MAAGYLSFSTGKRREGEVMLSASPVKSKEKGLEGFSLSRSLWLGNYLAQNSAHASLQPSVTGTGQPPSRRFQPCKAKKG